MSKKENQLHIIQPELKQHLMELSDLLSKVFSDSLGYWNGMDKCLNGYIAKSNYDWKSSRIGFLNDELISHYGIWDFRIRIGESRIRVGGVGAVGTHQHYRNHGYMVDTGNECMKAMIENGYDVSLLYGIKDFYERFGYCPAWASVNAYLPVSELSHELPKEHLRKGPNKNRKDLAQLYNKENRSLTGTAVQPTFPVTNPFFGCEGYVWRRNGKPSGFVYCVPGAGKLMVRLYAGEVSHVLGALKQLCQQFNCGEICFQQIHLRSEIARAIRKYSCRFETQYSSTGEAMVRIINLRSTLEKIAPELSNRMQRCNSNWSGKLLIGDPREKVVLQIEKQNVSVIEGDEADSSIVGGEEIAQLILGSKDPWETVAHSGINLDGDASSVLAILFPSQDPGMSMWDRF